jgi:radical SAM superfamily enzyme YgiQ (UPF0313 family)
MQLDGRVPDIFMVSSMQIHSAPCLDLIRDACSIDADHRPLIIAGGPKVIYEPWDVFSADPEQPRSADVAVTGEEYVLLNLLEVLLAERASGESMRSVFARARDCGILDEIPGLVYARHAQGGAIEGLVDTGIQRIVRDLDETPDPVPGYGILEPPGRSQTLASKPLPRSRVRRHTPLGALVLTLGCKFSCSYCPIPAYNQKQYRTKSGQRIADEMTRLYSEYGLQYYFGTDDNFFNDRARTLDICETLASAKVDGKDLRHKIRWGTEVTVHDTLKMLYDLRLVRRAGVRALWLGVEDMTGELIKKGQTVNKTLMAFREMLDRGICPMPMLMHHDSQPLLTRGDSYGLLNQLHLLWQAGAVSIQVLMITPATGSKLYEEAYTSGLLYEQVGTRRVENYMLDGNYVVASRHPEPWRKQLNLLTAYLFFYNPLRLIFAIAKPTNRLYLADLIVQFLGMWGLSQTLRRTFGWFLRLLFGRLKRRDKTPASRIPMRGADGGEADHALPGTARFKG